MSVAIDDNGIIAECGKQEKVMMVKIHLFISLIGYFTVFFRKLDSTVFKGSGG